MTQPQATRAGQDDLLKKAIGYSIGLHVLVFAAFTVRAVFYPSEPLQLENSIRVDIVALPDKKSAELPPAPPPASEKPAEKPAEKPVEAKPEPAPVEVAKPDPKPAPVEVKKEAPKPDSPTVNLQKSKREQDAALKRMEALARLEKMMKKPSGGAPEKGTTTASAAESTLVKGNEISHGSSLKGIARLDHRTYLTDLDAHIKRHWRLPRWMVNANFKARVIVYLDAKGFVTKKVMTKSSENQEFNDRVMQAIEEASPFPPPPANLANLFAVDGVELGFPD